jgi:hypothetical protein
MRYDQYGRPIMGHQQNYGQAQQPMQNYGQQFQAPMNTTADINMPNMSELGGKQGVPWVRFPFFPTAPFYSTDPRVGTQTRFYGATLLYSDGDYAANQEAIRIVQFDIPCRLIAINAAAITYDSVTNKVSPLSDTSYLDLFLFRAEYTTGDKLHTAARLASTVCGDMMNPGELGGVGYTIDQGASFVLGMTPLALGNSAGGNELKLRIDITLHCLEVRGPSNFTRG